MPPNDCTQTTDPLKLIREGTSQAQRLSTALDPAFAPVDQHTPAHAMIFAQAYSAFLKYYDSDDTAVNTWTPFFSKDVSVQLAAAAVQDVAYYKSNIKSYFDFLDNADNGSNEAGLKDRLGYLFSSAATLAKQLDGLKEGLPAELPLKAILQNLTQSQLAPAFKKLMLYYRDGLNPDAPPPDGPYHNDVPATFSIMGRSFTLLQIKEQTLSKDWITEDSAADWHEYLAHVDDISIYPPTGVYGSGPTLFERINHIASHNLFTSVFDRFLKVFARTVNEAGSALNETFTARDTHEPHYALFLAFLRLFEYARAESNTLTTRHLDFYYREVLRLKEKPSEPGNAHFLLELAKQVPAYLIDAGKLFRAGKDKLGIPAFFAADRDTVVNQAKVTALKTVYRHGDEKVGTNPPSPKHRGRIYASPIANSDDGLGAKLTTTDLSWHPFHNKQYQDGVLVEIKMPRADIGFAIASHYLLMAEGTRSIALDFTVAGALAGLTADYKDELRCLLTSKEGWVEKPALAFTAKSGLLHVEVSLTGADPAVVPYSQKIHGYGFATSLPVLLVKLRHVDSSEYIYARLQDVVIRRCDLKVVVEGLKTLAVSNDFGPVDTSKPFQPYGNSPVANTALIIGSKEVFQKQLLSATLSVAWLTAPAPFKAAPAVNIDFLMAGQWTASGIATIPIGSTTYGFTANLEFPVVDQEDMAANEFYATTSRHGFVRLRLNAGFGQNAYQTDLIKYLRKDTDADGNLVEHPGDPPVGPVMSALTLGYAATQTISLDSSEAESFGMRAARFFHLAPFGQAEQHPTLNSARKVYLLPQFDFKSQDSGTESAAEFYIGVGGLQPPQNLSLLMQVAAGTADPLAEKPDPHILWSYLRGNEWIRFASNEIDDQTAGLLSSGIVALSMPGDASDANTLLPSGMHWIRLSVETRVDSVCRLLMVAAQAVEATFADKGNDPAFSAAALPPGTISKLDQPDAAIKQVAQLFATFGGRGAEAAADFYTRVSERLRHKDRALDLWDSEHLILEAFPQIYKTKCLNHTQFEPSESGAGIYRELAPGHVTIVTIPNQQFQKQLDPLRPYTSLDLLHRIEKYLHKKFSCFVRLHVRNPQFEEVRMAFKLRLQDGYDETFYVNKLQEEITRFLSPWAFDGDGYRAGGNPSFGGKIYKSVLIDFVEELAYVDYLTDVQLFHDIGGIQGNTDKNAVEGSRAVSILVSVPAKKHLIEIIKPGGPGAPGELCPCEAS